MLISAKLTASLNELTLTLCKSIEENFYTAAYFEGFIFSINDLGKHLN